MRRWFGRRENPESQAGQDLVADSSNEVTFHQAMLTQVRFLLQSARRNGGALPIEASLQLFSMADALRELVDHTLVAPATIDEQIAIEFMLTDYIPSTVNAYINSRADPIVKEQLLIEQLALLVDQVHLTTEAVYSHDSAQLEINGRFLREKFG